MLVITTDHDGGHHFANEAEHRNFFFRIQATNGLFKDLASSVQDIGETGFAGISKNHAYFAPVMGRSPDALNQPLFFKAGYKPHNGRML